MPVKRYGIYLAYGPTVDFRAEGLGRHLASLLSAAQRRDDIRFVIACPSWSRDNLRELCESERIDPGSFDVVGPQRKPALLRVYESWKRRRESRRRGLRRTWFALFEWCMRGVARGARPMRRVLAGSRSVWPLLVAALFAAAAATLVLPVVLVASLFARGSRRGAAWTRKLAMRAYRAVADERRDQSARELLAGHAPKDVASVVSMYRTMMDVEIEALHRAIAATPQVGAWYCPTAFWPSVTRIDAPHLICVPDVVLADFPATFSGVGGDRLLETYRQIETTLQRGRHFVTYSAFVRDSTLVTRFGIDPARVAVVEHGAVRLDRLIGVVDSPEPALATDALARELVQAVMRRFRGTMRPGMLGPDARYLFYASQFRPHKNVVNLLRALAHLLRQRYVSCRLVLTGNPAHSAEIGEYVSRLALQEEVVFLHGLAPQELAAFYRRAALAVNPSLFEGGMPFTFSESVSVGTPVVMARIAVTEQALADADLARDMLFDPYDWRDIAGRIEWALDHREALYARQRAYFERAIAPRTWAHALDDYVALLDRIAASKRAEEAA